MSCIRDLFVNYDKYRVVRLKGSRVLGSVALCYRITQMLVFILVLTYIGIFNLWIKGGYKEYDDVTSVMEAHVTGVLKTHFTQEQLDQVPPENRRLYNKFWDVVDELNPGNENSFFVPTNVAITPNQKLGTCGEHPSATSLCHNTRSTCVADSKDWLVDEDGFRTGRCVRYRNTQLITCQVYGWCPIEMNKLPSSKVAIFEDVKYFVATITNRISFQKFKLKTTNGYQNTNKSCRYSKEDPFCRNFQILSMIEEAENPTNFSDLAMMGAVVNINIDWTCDLGLINPFGIPLSPFGNFTQICLPKYTFTIMEPMGGFKSKDRAGWYYRKGEYENGRRTMFKMYGIDFKVNVTGKASRFSLFNTLVELFTGFGVLFVVDIIFDGIAMRCSKSLRSHRYLSVRFENLEEHECNDEEGEQDDKGSDNLEGDEDGAHENSQEHVTDDGTIGYHSPLY